MVTAQIAQNELVASIEADTVVGSGRQRLVFLRNRKSLIGIAILGFFTRHRA